jgi:hypothetical protein
MATERFTPEQVEAALRVSAGIRSAAAVKLGCSPSTVSNYIARHPALREVEAEILDQNLDLAETKLLTAIRDGNLTAVIFFLKTKGKARGYTERAELTGADGGPIDVTKLSDEELERIARGDPSPHAGAGGAGETPEGESPQ